MFSISLSLSFLTCLLNTPTFDGVAHRHLLYTSHPFTINVMPTSIYIPVLYLPPFYTFFLDTYTVHKPLNYTDPTSLLYILHTSLSYTPAPFSLA